MNIARKIKELRIAKGLRQKELAEHIGVTAQAVSMWEASLRDPNPSQRSKLCKFFNVTEAELFGAIVPVETPLQRVPIISWVYANRFQEIHDNFPVGTADEHIYTSIKGKNIFALKIKSDCMEPEFRDGDIVIIQPHTDIGQNDYIVVADRDNNEATLKQLKIYGNKRILHPLNAKYQDIELDHKKRYIIVGKVVAKEKRY